MLNSIKKYFYVNRVFLFIFFIFTIYFLVFAFIPFLKNGFPLTWDHPGHIGNADFFKDHILPWQAKWDNLFYAGFPQDTFYPPLIHYLNGFLGTFLGVQTVYMSFCFLFIILLPWALYWFLLGLNFRRGEAAVGILLVLSLLSSENFPTGVNIFSLISGGVFTNAGAFLFLIFYLGSIVRYETKKRKYLFFSVLLLSAIILSHFLVAIAAVFISLFFLVFKEMPSPREKTIFYIKHCIFSFLICGFWLIPFFYYSSYANSTAIGVKLLFSLRLPFFIFIATGALLGFLENDKKYLPILFSMIFFLLFSYVDFLEWKIPMHTYRLFIFVIVFGAIIAAKLLFNKQNKITKIILILIFVFGLYFQLFVDLMPRGVKVYEGGGLYRSFKYHKLYKFPEDLDRNYDITAIKSLLPKVNGRLITFSGDTFPFLHDLRTIISRETKIEQMLGLFIESGVNSRILGILYKNLTKDHGFIWGIPEATIDRKEYLRLSKPVIRKILDSFNINYILSAYPLSNSFEDEMRLVDRPAIEKDNTPYFLYEFGRSNFIDLLYEAPEPVYGDSDWKKALNKWLMSKKTKNFAYLPKHKKIPDYVAARGDSLDVLEKNNGYLKMKVNAEQTVPIYVKISFFPRWRAYVNGERTDIYRVSPNLMLVYGRGIVELKYQRTLVDYIGLFFSAVGLVFLIFYLKKKPRWAISA